MEPLRRLGLLSFNENLDQPNQLVAKRDQPRSVQVAHADQSFAQECDSANHTILQYLKVSPIGLVTRVGDPFGLSFGGVALATGVNQVLVFGVSFSNRTSWVQVINAKTVVTFGIPALTAQAVSALERELVV